MLQFVASIKFVTLLLLCFLAVYKHVEVSSVIDAGISKLFQNMTKLSSVVDEVKPTNNSITL